MTHINAYYGAVELKKQALGQAQAELDQAEADLEAKKAEESPAEVVEQPEWKNEPEVPKKVALKKAISKVRKSKK